MQRRTLFILLTNENCALSLRRFWDAATVSQGTLTITTRRYQKKFSVVIEFGND